MYVCCGILHSAIFGVGFVWEEGVMWRLFRIFFVSLFSVFMFLGVSYSQTVTRIDSGERTNSSVLVWSVEFSDSVTGVTSDDFAFTTDPLLTDLDAPVVTGEGTSYVVTLTDSDLVGYDGRVTLSGFADGDREIL